MSDNKRLRHEQKQTHEGERELRQDQSSTRDFSSIDEMLRFDAAQTTVPVSLAARLNKSIALEPKAVKPWWRRLWRRD